MSENQINTNNTKWIIPCGAAKAAEATTAADLYTGSYFREALATALYNTTPENIFILSAKHGLLPLTQRVEPYELKMGDIESVTDTEVAVQMNRLGWFTSQPDLQAFLPKKYLAVLEDAARMLGLIVADAYEANCGIGENKAVLARHRKAA